MSDEDKDFIDVESDDERTGDADNDLQFANPADKRAHHNALERKRRDHIKESFNGLRDTLPKIRGEKASRAQILKCATDYIMSMKGVSGTHKKAIDELRNENKQLEEQIATLEQLADSNEFSTSGSVENFIEDSLHRDEPLPEPDLRPPRRKKAKN
ncbi:protein max-like [Watersipora subatra]|uniref:protein max-like n=1 Tax=Watersipora subatra TaxID=2589382 RepID=UPI00355C3462